VYLHAFLSFALDGDEWSASSSSHIMSKFDTVYSLRYDKICMLLMHIICYKETIVLYILIFKFQIGHGKI